VILAAHQRKTIALRSALGRRPRPRLRQFPRTMYEASSSRPFPRAIAAPTIAPRADMFVMVPTGSTTV